MKELNRRQFFNVLVTGTAAFVGVTAASAAKRTFAAVHDYTDSTSALPGSIHDNTASNFLSPKVEPDSDLMLAGSVRRSCRRTARRTARRTTRRVNRRQERLDDD
jgi:hypothetical protein